MDTASGVLSVKEDGGKADPNTVVMTGTVDPGEVSARRDADAAQAEAALTKNCKLPLVDPSVNAGVGADATEEPTNEYIVSFLSTPSTSVATAFCDRLAGLGGKCGKALDGQVMPTDAEKKEAIASASAENNTLIIITGTPDVIESLREAVKGPECEGDDFAYNLSSVTRASQAFTPEHHMVPEHHYDHISNRRRLQQLKRTLLHTPAGLEHYKNWHADLVAKGEHLPAHDDEHPTGAPLHPERVPLKQYDPAEDTEVLRLVADAATASVESESRTSVTMANNETGGRRGLLTHERWVSEAKMQTIDGCYHPYDRGRSYRGGKNTDYQGVACIAWDNLENYISTNNRRFYRQEGESRDPPSRRSFPNAGLDSNFCRNPYPSVFQGPVCYIDNGAVVYAQICGLPTCASPDYVSADQTKEPKYINNWGWGLDRLDQLDAPYDFSTGKWKNSITGAGTHLFVFDTGVRFTHEEFTGRTGVQRNCIGSNPNDAQDDGGHGSHVAGIAAGTRYGVASGATVHSIKVLRGKGGGTGTALSQCADWVINYKRRTIPNEPAVAVMSLGFDGTVGWTDSMLRRMKQAGIAVAVAAGNDDIDACGASPAFSRNGMTVAASNYDDTKAKYSNWGSCIDIWAPGTSIKSASHLSDTGYVVFQGTSMAAPFVAGALLLAYQVNPRATVDQAYRWVLDAGISGRIHHLEAKHIYPYAISRDESRNIAVSENLLLHIPTNSAKTPPTCTDALPTHAVRDQGPPVCSFRCTRCG